jgi:hypothetical protein
MLGIFQQSQLRIEVPATSDAINRSLLQPIHLSKWLLVQGDISTMSAEICLGDRFTTWIGLIQVDHQVDVVQPNCLRLLLSGGIHGFHEWYWGEGWVQSRLEGITILPVNLGQTLSLLRLRQFLQATGQ